MAAQVSSPLDVNGQKIRFTDFQVEYFTDGSQSLDYEAVRKEIFQHTTSTATLGTEAAVTWYLVTVSLGVAEVDAAIVSAVLFIAKSLGLTSTAEGVETPEQAAYLASEGCDQLQGYVLSRPLPAAEMTRFLKSKKALELLKSTLQVS